ncbi:MAG: hypothetical protein WCK47_00760 [bacterium]|nr:hypothetical protein [Candidatus Sumerlaeota bacterium]
MSLLLLFIGFALALACAAGRPACLRHAPWERVFCVVMLAFIVVPGWRMSFPQQNVDYDTWLQLARFRHHRIDELFKQHRPVQYYIEYWIVRGMSVVEPDLRRCSAAMELGALAAAFLVMVRMRRSLFGSRFMAWPALAIMGYMMTAGGEFMIDSWNDHLALEPFYVAGVAWLIGFRASPRRAAYWIAGVFFAESLLHTAEPWLWSIGLAAATFKSGKLSKDHKMAIVALFIFMVCTTLAIIRIFPGGSVAAGDYIAHYSQKNGPMEALREYVRGFGRGGFFKLPGRVFLPLCALLLAFLALRACYLRKFIHWLWLILSCAALGFPLIYETSNPERYHAAALLWALLGARFAREALARGRLVFRRRSSMAGQAHTSVLSTLRCVSGPVAAYFIAGLFVFGVAIRIPVVWNSRDEAHVYNQFGEMMAGMLDPRGILAVAPSGSFFLWQEYLFPGKVMPVKSPADAVDAARKAAAGQPVYFNAPAAEMLTRATSATLILVFERPGDPATPIYELKGSFK